MMYVAACNTTGRHAASNHFEIGTERLSTSVHSFPNCIESRRSVDPSSVANQLETFFHFESMIARLNMDFLVVGFARYRMVNKMKRLAAGLTREAGFQTIPNITILFIKFHVRIVKLKIVLKSFIK